MLARGLSLVGVCDDYVSSVASGVGRLLTNGQLPARPNEMTGIAIRNALQVVLVLRFGFPEVPGGRHFGDHLARPQAGSLNVGYGVFRDPLLFGMGVENRRAIARAPVVALTIQGGRIVDLKEKLQQLPEADLLGIEIDLNR